MPRCQEQLLPSGLWLERCPGDGGTSRFQSACRLWSAAQIQTHHALQSHPARPSLSMSWNVHTLCVFPTACEGIQRRFSKGLGRCHPNLNNRNTHRPENKTKFSNIRKPGSPKLRGERSPSVTHPSGYGHVETLAQGAVKRCTLSLISGFPYLCSDGGDTPGCRCMDVSPETLAPRLKGKESSVCEKDHAPWLQVLPPSFTTTVPPSLPPSDTEETQRFDFQRLRTRSDRRKEKMCGSC